jgi:hypothetical protein
MFLVSHEFTTESFKISKKKLLKNFRTGMAAFDFQVLTALDLLPAYITGVINCGFCFVFMGFFSLSVNIWL